MKCEICKINEAELTITFLNEDQNNKISLCKSCSEISVLTYNHLNSTVEEKGQSEKQLYTVEYDLKCPHCNTEIADFLATGQTGCSYCYEIFKKEIDDFFKSHSIQKHPHRILNYLSDQLFHAIEEENFEYAATLRDRIKVLSSGEVDEFIEN